MILAAIESQKQLLLEETTGLKRDIKNLDLGDPRNIAILQVPIDKDACVYIAIATPCDHLANLCAFCGYHLLFQCVY